MFEQVSLWAKETRPLSSAPLYSGTKHTVFASGLINEGNPDSICDNNAETPTYPIAALGRRQRYSLTTYKRRKDRSLLETRRLKE